MMNTLPEVSYAWARTHRILIQYIELTGPLVLICPTSNLGALAEISRLGMGFLVREVSVEEWDSALTSRYAQQGSGTAKLMGELEEDVDLSQLMHDMPAIEDLLESSDDAPMIRMFNALLTQASREGASDIHIEISEQGSQVRFRVDGTLREVVSLKKALHSALISRLKIMAQMDIAEKRLPQDGRIALRVGGRPVDVRVSTIPTGHGERAVLRLLDKEAGRLDLSKLGMSALTLTQFDGLIRAPHGVVLVTGPTGSGKTTTLYAALSRLDFKTTNVLTVEDPIEYHLDGIGQTQVNARIDLTFGRALRAILRQDPDVIMIGEIRDNETAQIAVQASLTGHLVLATLHTNDAISAVTRLIDMGIEPFLLASSLLGVLGQRLIRKWCPDCHDDSERVIHCMTCGRTGYQGRTGVYELFTVDTTVRALIHERAAEQKLKDYANNKGFKNMYQDGLRWVEAGITSSAELLRVTGEQP